MEDNNKIIDLVTYNLWANKRIITWLESNDQELITKDCQSSFSSILKTVKHILDGQILYYSILNQSPYNESSENSVQDKYRQLIEQSIAFLEYVKKQKNFNESRLVKTKFLSGEFPQFELIKHCMNHSTFHRGQIITIGHQLKLTKAPSTDMLFYFIERNKH
ncbi:hypothetical protein WH52_12355 [Tenacibaculum holothuriorum]|uniref:Damage-inducible protein DinB n=1 Tax=Tenacibaculum holothuriorum TaxID=1635173 RepID=A0A1Y2PBT9_9FLAO|nr:DinB family protein [Tenacibaculum holothuriorum]OSY87247.1 hypothetical protein WH52_12355 [Tenacibaculum holothuriorum]